MRFSDKFQMALSSLIKRKLRTLLTVMGVMIGVAAIVTMMGLGEGLNRQSMEMIEEFGGMRTRRFQDRCTDHPIHAHGPDHRGS